MRTKALPALLISNLAFSSLFAAAKTESATVPMILDHNRIIISIGVNLPNGTVKKVQAWVDNGTPTMTITEHLSNELGLKTISKPTATEGLMVSAPAKIQIGGMEIGLIGPKESIEVENSPTVAGGVNAEISLSSTVLKNYDVVIDYPDKKFTIASAGVVHFSGKAVEGFFNPQNYLIQIPGEVDGHHFNLALDIGTPVSFISADLITKWKKAHTSWPTVTGAIGIANLWGLDDEPKWQLLRLNKISYGGIEFPDPIAVSFPADRLDYFKKRAGIATAGLFGAASMLNYRVGIDYAHQKVYFERITNPVGAGMDLVGLVLRPEERGYYSILGVADYNGKLSVDGVLKGDILKKVNNISIDGLTMGKVWSLLRGTPGSVYTLTVERAGKQFTVKTKVQRFLGNGRS